MGTLFKLAYYIGKKRFVITNSSESYPESYPESLTCMLYSFWPDLESSGTALYQQPCPVHYMLSVIPRTYAVAFCRYIELAINMRRSNSSNFPVSHAPRF